MSASIIAILICANIGLIYVMLAMPLGMRTVRLSRRVKASREKLWNALWPLGGDAGWSGALIGAEPVAGKPGEACLTLSWEGRNGRPIKRMARFDDVEAPARFSMRYSEDTSLDPGFWKNYREDVSLEGVGTDTLVILSQTDRYRGLAFLIYRFFALRRQIIKLKRWAETGVYLRGGIFEHPLTQIGFAALSTLLLWPLFGLTSLGLLLSAILTTVVALHELGHMTAFRLAGHRRARMIFIPLLGGIAIGGRPYDNRFEAAFVALMGAGFSAFLVAISIAGGLWLQHDVGSPRAAEGLFILAGCAALFNLANLVPIWKFDGGQVLRQICPNPVVLALASFSLLLLCLSFGYCAGFSWNMLFGAGVVAAILSFVTAGIGAKPRYELKEITPVERLAIAAALLAVFCIHGYGLVWAIQKLT